MLLNFKPLEYIYVLLAVVAARKYLLLDENLGVGNTRYQQYILTSVFVVKASFLSFAS